MRRAFFGPATVAIAAAAHAGTVTVTPDAASYAVGQTITLNIVGNPQGGSKNGIWGRLIYSAALTDPSGITPTQNTHTVSGGSVVVGPLRQGKGYAGYGYSDAFNQIFNPPPASVGQNTTSVVKVIAASEGTVEFFWEEPSDGLGNHLSYFDAAPGNPAASVTVVPEPGATVSLALGFLGLLAIRRRRASP